MTHNHSITIELYFGLYALIRVFCLYSCDQHLYSHVSHLYVCKQFLREIFYISHEKHFMLP